VSLPISAASFDGIWEDFAGVGSGLTGSYRTLAGDIVAGDEELARGSNLRRVCCFRRARRSKFRGMVDLGEVLDNATGGLKMVEWPQCSPRGPPREKGRREKPLNAGARG